MIYVNIYIYICSTLHYITLHYTTLHYITLHYITLHSTTLHYTTLHIYSVCVYDIRYSFVIMGMPRNRILPSNSGQTCDKPFNFGASPVL